MSDFSKIELILKRSLPLGFEYGLAEAPADEGTLFKEERDYLKSIKAPARKESYILGRTACHEALKKIGVNGPVLRAQDGRPIWPQNITGSLSNKAGIGVAAVTNNPKYLAFGIDLEEHLKNANIAKKVCRPSEQTWVALDRGTETLTKLFSAKEALFKALYPQTGIFFGFQDAEFTISEDGFRCINLIKFPHIPVDSIKIKTTATDGLVVSLVWMDRS